MFPPDARFSPSHNLEQSSSIVPADPFQSTWTRRTPTVFSTFLNCAAAVLTKTAGPPRRDIRANEGHKLERSEHYHISKPRRACRFAGGGGPIRNWARNNPGDRRRGELPLLMRWPQVTPIGSARISYPHELPVSKAIDTAAHPRTHCGDEDFAQKQNSRHQEDRAGRSRNSEPASSLGDVALWAASAKGKMWLSPCRASLSSGTGRSQYPHLPTWLRTHC